MCSRSRVTVFKEITVWAALSSRGIIEPFFLQVTVNYSRYAEILHEFVAIHNALEVALEASWFMQDDTRPHRTPKVFTLDEYFDNHVIALDYAIGKSKNWSPYSSDLKPCDCFPWGHVKDVVYCQYPTSLAELQ